MAKTANKRTENSAVATQTITDGAPKAFMFKNNDGAVRARVTQDEFTSELLIANVCFRNYPYPGRMEAFGSLPEFQTVDKYYPLAKGGPLFVDEPQDEGDIEICKKKAAAIRKHGGRYLYITQTTDLFEVMKQLETA